MLSKGFKSTLMDILIRNFVWLKMAYNSLEKVVRKAKNKASAFRVILSKFPETIDEQVNASQSLFCPMVRGFAQSGFQSTKVSNRTQISKQLDDF
jgi:hypothetical protein